MQSTEDSTDQLALSSPSANNLIKWSQTYNYPHTVLLLPAGGVEGVDKYSHLTETTPIDWFDGTSAC